MTSGDEEIGGVKRSPVGVGVTPMSQDDHSMETPDEGPIGEGDDQKQPEDVGT